MAVLSEAFLLTLGSSLKRNPNLHHRFLQRSPDVARPSHNSMGVQSPGGSFTSKHFGEIGRGQYVLNLGCQGH